MARKRFSDEDILNLLRQIEFPIPMTFGITAQADKRLIEQSNLPDGLELYPKVGDGMR